MLLLLLRPLRLIPALPQAQASPVKTPAAAPARAAGHRVVEKGVRRRVSG